MRTTYFDAMNRMNRRKSSSEAERISHATTRAWEKYVERGRADEEIEQSVRSEILESWARCTDSGISALAVATPQKIGEEDVSVLRRKNRSLCQAARAAFERLAPHLTDSGAILILTDQTGTVIDAIGDPQTLELGQEIQLEIGGVWDEAVIGTNGIGTALRTGKPTYVHASEHFCQGIQSWTCAGVPVFDPLDRSIIGVVDLSGPPDIFQPHNVALVVAAAREIEIALAEQQRQERTTLLEAYIDLPRTHDSDEAIVLLNSSGRIVFSRNTDKASDQSRDNLPIGRQLLNLSSGMTDGDLAAALPPNLAATVIDILKSGNEVQGAALILPGKAPSLTRPKLKGVTIKPRAGVEESEIVIIGECPKMLEAIEFARRAAMANVTVLVQGETGVGKELFARLIHSHHTKEDVPYVAVNCAAISGELIGGELFGHVAGAFTGALREGKSGKFEQANGGVLCLDEIGDMPPELQTYLLRTLEQRAVYRIGCNKRRPIDVQLIAMTNRNLRQDIEAGRFRRDLFYRIGTIVIDVPPLRERGRDIDQLVQHFNFTLSTKFERGILEFSPEAMAALRTYRWPGNVRELRNTIERLCLLHGDGAVGLSDLPDEICNPQSSDFLFGGTPAAATGQMDLDGIESVAIQRAIGRENGNLTKVALTLGISRPTLYRKIRQYNLDRGK
ncbi:sigma-54-dependent Fis family transcriptional regulator [Sedimentitalea todarodis]|uniref:Sigma-54-dependent Fis family transcriptional regulator n=1 Tax=Sedimentitalea todarodis TaxID=1631240 RepID=A0ABU3VE61_9RHOB|nr:sigma-54-dependent Fis family transcriptional regulator [Sedimentitalea todarodis]MDU9004462.1 sigma-54-dependent Fis family transcriptional regulator [Sedimentitalea todarodis]